MSAAVANRLKAIKDHGGIRSREIARLVGTTPETVSRWNTGRTEPQPEHLEKLLALEWLLDRLSELYTPEDARLWLYSPHKLLAGDRPADRIRAGKTSDVLTLVAQLIDGAFA
jgi:transcriptional regulator with XRE-family HTH domain